VIGTALVGLAVLPSVGDAVNAAMKPGLGRMFAVEHAAVGCRVVSVIDGDTVTLWCPGRAPERARLMGFDTPELFRPRCPREAHLALRAKWHLRLMLWRGGRLTVVRRGHDRYGRALVALAIDDVPVMREMIDAGLARPYGGGARAGWCGQADAGAGAPERPGGWLSVMPAEQRSSASLSIAVRGQGNGI
jgi:endonuclease YncB( thermonuclease family)